MLGQENLSKEPHCPQLVLYISYVHLFVDSLHCIFEEVALNLQNARLTTKTAIPGVKGIPYRVT